LFEYDYSNHIKILDYDPFLQIWQILEMPKVAVTVLHHKAKAPLDGGVQSSGESRIIFLPETI